MSARRHWALRVLQLSILGAVVWLTAGALRGQWAALRHAAGSLRPEPLPFVASCVAVLALYAVQVHAWRTLVSAWGGRPRFWTAARIWAVSNLARFAPASPIATTGTMSVLGSRAGIHPAAAAGAAVLGTLLNLGVGFVVLLATGAQLLPRVAPNVPVALAPVLAAVAAGALLALPLLLPRVARTIGAIVRRPIALPAMPPRVLATAVTANLAAWLLYGLAFRWLAAACFPAASGGWISYTAVFTGGYLAGWLALPVPAGWGVREYALTLGLTELHLLPAPEAAVLVLVSRLVLTVLEVLPGATFLALGAVTRSPSTRDVPP